MIRAVIVLLVFFFGFAAYAFGKVSKDADEWEDWWDEQRDSGLYTDDE